MKDLQIINPQPIKRCVKDHVEIVLFANRNILMHNHKNNNNYFLSVETHEYEREINFRHMQDGKSNVFCTGGFSFSFMGKTYELNQPGDSVNVEDGTIACCLQYCYMQALVEKVFYEPHQERVFDFLKEEFLISALQELEWKKI